MKTFCFCCFIALFASSCDPSASANKPVTPVPTVENATQTTYDTAVSLDNGFEIHFARKADIGIKSEEDWYSVIAINKDGKTVVSDTSEQAYSSRNTSLPSWKNYPLLLPLANGAFEVIVLRDNYPRIPQAIAFRVKDGKMAGKQHLAIFYNTAAANLDADENKEFAGEPDMMPAVERGKIAYDPILYYELRGDGLALDSALTMKQNAAIYGKFMGFDVDVNKTVSNKLLPKREAEIKRIEAAK